MGMMFVCETNSLCAVIGSSSSPLIAWVSIPEDRLWVSLIEEVRLVSLASIGMNDCTLNSSGGFFKIIALSYEISFGMTDKNKARAAILFFKTISYVVIPAN